MNHISIEGMDGVGKSTTCKKLAEKLGYVFVEKPLHYLFDNNDEIRNYQEIAKKVNSNPNRNFTSMFYGLGSIYMYELFKDKNIVTDRHLASNYAWSGTEYNKDVYKLVVSKIGKPNMTVILYSPTDVIVSRLKGRDVNDKDIKRASKSEDIYNKMITFCKEYEFPYIVLDTSKLTPDEVVDCILKELKKRG
jgi:thymidylate kinase